MSAPLTDTNPDVAACGIAGGVRTLSQRGSGAGVARTEGPFEAGDPRR
jgi:hypothetical protein